MAVVMLALSGLFFLGHALSWLFVRTKIPDLLILTILGYIIGPVLGLVRPDDLGKVAPIITTVALIVILYEGGLRTTWQAIQASGFKALKLSLLTFTAAASAGILVAMILAFRGPESALMLGFAIGTTSSAIVIPMVRYLSISEETRTTLALESAFTDVLCIVLVLVMVEGYLSGEVGFGRIALAIGPKSLMALAVGGGLALLGAALKLHFPTMIPKVFAGEAWALFSYGITELAGLNGALSVLALGFVVGNLQALPEPLKKWFPESPVTEVELNTLSEESLILRVFFFLYLGFMVKVSDWNTVSIALILTLLAFGTRGLIARFFFQAKGSLRLDTLTLFAMGPRGLACAVVASIPAQVGHPDGPWLRDVAFAMIPMTILLTAVLVILIENERTRPALERLFYWSRHPADVPNENRQLKS